MVRRDVILLVAVAACGGSGGEPAGAELDLGPPRLALPIGVDGQDDTVFDARVDPAGDIVVVGGYSDRLSEQAPFGRSPIYGFVTKRSGQDGTEKWRTELVKQGDKSVVTIAGLAVDASGAIFVTGMYTGMVDFGGQVLGPNPDPLLGDMFVARYSAAGQLEWVHGLTGTASASAVGITIDGAGHAVVAGEFSYGTLTLGDQHLSASESNHVGIVIAFDPGGALAWAHFFPTSERSRTADIATAPDGGVVVAGTIDGTTTFGDVTLEPGARWRGYIARCDTAGASIDARLVGAGAPMDSTAMQVGVTPDDVVAVQTLDSMGAPTTNSAIHALADAGEMWSATPVDHDAGSPQLRSLAIAPDGRVLSSTWVDAPFNADHPESVTGHLEVIAYDAHGEPAMATLGSRRRGSAERTILWRSRGEAGAFLLVGEFAGVLDFGAGPFGNHGQDDLDGFVFVLDPPEAR